MLGIFRHCTDLKCYEFKFLRFLETTLFKLSTDVFFNVCKKLRSSLFLVMFVEKALVEMLFFGNLIFSEVKKCKT